MLRLSLPAHPHPPYPPPLQYRNSRNDLRNHPLPPFHRPHRLPRRCLVQVPLPSRLQRRPLHRIVSNFLNLPRSRKNRLIQSLRTPLRQPNRLPPRQHAPLLNLALRDPKRDTNQRAARPSSAVTSPTRGAPRWRQKPHRSVAIRSGCRMPSDRGGSIM